MDDESTQQPSTAPVGQNTQSHIINNISLKDELDVICILHPCSRPAFDMAEKVAELTPQHVLQNAGLSYNYQDVVELCDDVESQKVKPVPTAVRTEDTPDMTDTQPTDAAGPVSGVRDIALRLSSVVRDVDMGFVFGRDSRKCDIVLDVAGNKAARVSNMHFRIFLNDNGMIMLEDTSTNGTLVDNVLLKHRRPFPGDSVRRIIQKGSVVALFVNEDRSTARFIIDIPQRSDEGAWRRNLEAYVATIKRARARKLATLRNPDSQGNLTQRNVPSPQSGEPNDTTQDYDPDDQKRDNVFITAGTVPWNHGMRWNGDGMFNIIGKVGSGAFATVYKLVNLTTGDELAAKEIEKRRFIKNGQAEMKITSELNILKRLQHPHVIESFDHVNTSRDLYILMEFVPYGDLSVHVGQVAKLSDTELRFVTKQMCQALAYLHDNGIAHRDIKPENIVKKAINPIWVKLADFGLSKIITQEEPTVYQTFCGTLLYCAPEVYPGFAQKRAGQPPNPKATRPHPYSTAVDIWSLAAVMFHLVCGIPPYEASAANHGVHMLDTIFEERFPRQKFDDADVHPDWELFFENSLQLTAYERWSARRLLKMPWLRRIPDVAPIQYQFQHADTDFAYEDESTDEEMEGRTATIIHDGGVYQQPGNELDASQLSLNDDLSEAESDDVSVGEASMLSVEPNLGTKNGLGIASVSNTPDTDSRVVEYPDLGSRYNLRSRHGSRLPSHIGIVSRRTSQNVRNLSSGKIPPPLVAQQEGRLFGEITESGVFGSPALMPRMVNAVQLPAPIQPQPQHLTSHRSVLAATNNLENNLSPPSRRTYQLRNAVSSNSLRGAEGQIGQLRMASPETEASAMSSLRNSPSGSIKSKHQLSDEEISVSNPTTLKRSRVSFSSRHRSSISLANEVGSGESPSFETSSKAVRTPDQSAKATTTTEATPRARKANIPTVNFNSGQSKSIQVAAAQVEHNVPDTTVARTFPNNATITSSSESAKRHASTTPNDSQSMPPPPRRTSTINSSRPPTPVIQENPIVPALGVLTPGRNSVPAAPVHVTLQRTEFGRHPGCTHKHPDIFDTRVPKSAFTIFLHDPAGNNTDADKDWTKVNFYAVIGTRCSGHILVNDIPMTRNKTGKEEKYQLGILQTGDVIEVFERDGTHLRFHVHFWFGTTKEPRDNQKNPFKLYLGNKAVEQTIARVEASRSDRTVKG